VHHDDRERVPVPRVRRGGRWLHRPGPPRRDRGVHRWVPDAGAE
jgi:hypothetical protein